MTAPPARRDRARAFRTLAPGSPTRHPGLAAADADDRSSSLTRATSACISRRPRQLASGLVPYRDVPFEYPPLALVPILVPYLLWPFGEVTLDVYTWLFAGWEAALIVALGLVLGEIVRVRTTSETRADEAPRALRNRLRWLECA